MSVTTSLVLIPLWMEGGEMWEPMAIGIIFGLLFAMVIIFLFVPVLCRKMLKPMLDRMRQYMDEGFESAIRCLYKMKHSG